MLKVKKQPTQTHTNCKFADLIKTINPESINLTILRPYDQACCNNNHYKDITHEVTSYVDDSTSSIGIKHQHDIIPYIKDYLEVLHKFYTCNMLKLNKTKTKFCITGTKSQVASVKDIKIRINDETIQNDTQVKILGFLFNSSNTCHNQIN